MLYDLLNEEMVGQKDFSLAEYESIYQELFSYPDGKEIIRSYNAMAAFLSYQDLSSFAHTQSVSADVAGCVFFDEAIGRP